MKLLAVLSLLAPLARAGEVHVPGDFPDLQAGIDGAAPGDVVIVHGSNFGPVVIDKPLTIIGDPPFLMFGGCASDPACATCPPPESAFRLEGPGAGKVTLVGFKIVNPDCLWPAPGISGGGFDELHLYSSVIAMSPAQTGLGHGADGIAVDVPFVAMTDSQIQAAGSDGDHCAGFLFDDEAAGIRAPGASVLLVDSVVTGGSSGLGASLCCAACSCPALPDPALGGAGGPGVVAGEVFLAGATVFGGSGATFFAYPAGTPQQPAGVPVECGSQPDGPPFVASAVHELDGVFGGPATAAVGGSYTLAWDLPGPATILFFALGAAPPVAAGVTPGFLALDPASLTYVGGLSSGAPQTLTVHLPPAAELSGVEFALQAWDATIGVTRPATTVILP